MYLKHNIYVIYDINQYIDMHIYIVGGLWVLGRLGAAPCGEGPSLREARDGEQLEARAAGHGGGAWRGHGAQRRGLQGVGRRSADQGLVLGPSGPWFWGSNQLD